ncbi:sensor histidine kinase [Stakelama tenebrarum]|uniref:Sensor histidine kinase n=1 Tax=Stakelama tenebrarum TaxID=2711215 RepID=A0A6G6Y8B9_9SPHN|nr:histidine kinase [Sphingosinithalassobacter tenebrarum]QIG81047.1 sensor histidine kinase [Sphingosinithalassobacter tenebrarum]
MMIIICFWVAQFSLLTAQRLLMEEDGGEAEILVPRIIVTLGAITLSMVIYRLIRSRPSLSGARRIGFVLLLALVGSLIHSAFNFGVFQLFMADMNWNSFSWISYSYAIIQWFWAYGAVSALLLAAIYGAELHEKERRLAEARALAHSAQMQALRYQLNPHFMFNTLNSIASLITSGQASAAERMVENLSDFLRAALSIDPSEDIALKRELALQSLYLAIEAVRFSDRLDVDIRVPAALENTRIPSLILQPLIENAIKHGVARSDGVTTLRVIAEAVADGLRFEVANTLPESRGEASGERIGLANVARRLSVRYGEDCRFAAGIGPEGWYSVSFVIPEAAP